MVNYWGRLKPLMDAKGMDIASLARAMKITFQGVAKVRDGGSFGSANNLKAAKLFGVNPEWLATGTGPRELPLMVAEPGAGFSIVGSEVSSTLRALQNLEAVIARVPPLLQQTARDAVVKWAGAQAGISETAAALDALAAATTKLPPAANAQIGRRKRGSGK